MPEQPSEWGPEGGFDSNDYGLKMIDPTDGTLQDLTGHALTSPNTNVRDALTISYVTRKNGRQVITTRTKRPAEVTNYTYTIGYPKRALQTPLLAIARKAGACEIDLARVYECPPDPQYEHWYAMNDVTIGPVVDATDPITNTEDRAILEKTSEITVTEEVIGWALRASIVHTVASKKINSSAFFIDECAGCDSSIGLDAIIVGGDGTAVPTVQITDNRFASITAKSVGALLDLGKDVVSVGDTIVIALATAATYAAATAGKLYVSQDRLATAAVATGITDPIARLVVTGNTIFAVGKDGSGNAVVHVSLNRGNSWTEITSSALPTGSALLDAAWDERGRRLYMVGEDGTVLVGSFSGSTLQITDISSVVNITDDLTTVVVLDYNQIFVGGLAGSAAETRDGGATWSTVVVAGTTAIASADGDKNRLVVGAGTNIYIRDILTSKNFRRVTLDFGQTLAGAVADVTMAPEEFNLFVVTTVSGEVVVMKPYYPGA